MIQETSLKAYTKTQPKINKNQHVVLEAVRKHSEGMTNAEIAHVLSWTINRVTPRCLELRKIGLLVDDGIRLCRVTHSSAHAYKAKVPVLPPVFSQAKAEEYADPNSLI